VPTRAETRQIAYDLVNRKAVRDRYARGLVDGTLAPAVELFFLYSAFGKPPEILEAQGLQPIIFQLPPGAPRPTNVPPTQIIEAKVLPS
jgi:hypothetical protein